MTRAAIGIDPGKDGGIVALVLDGSGIRCVYQALTKHVAPNLEPDLCYRAVMDARNAVIEYVDEGIDYQIVGVLERVGAMPKQGLSSTFSFGHGRGVFRGVLAGHGWHVLEPVPTVWQAAVLANIPGPKLAPGAGKDERRKAVRARYMSRASQVDGLDLIPPGCRVPQDGLGAACCLALFGLREGGSVEHTSNPGDVPKFIAAVRAIAVGR